MLKKLLAGMLVVVMVAALLVTTGCSTPKVALKVNDTEITMGEYLAYAYSVFSQVYYNQGLYYSAAINGTDVWAQEFTYGEGDDAKTVKLAEYVKLMAKDQAVRQVAVQELMKKYGISRDEDDLKQLEQDFASVSESNIIGFGFNKESYRKAIFSLQLDEPALFYGLYGEGGSREVSETDRHQYFDENFLSYKIIEIALTDDEGNALEEAAVAEVKSQLEGYLKQYNETGDFDAVIAAYKKATAAAEEDADAETTEEETSEEVDNRVDTNVKSMGDDDFAAAIKKVEIGKAAIQQFKKGGTTETMALILRFDPNDDPDRFTNATETILQQMKYEELDEEIKKYMKDLKVEMNQTAFRRADPTIFTEDAG